MTRISPYRSIVEVLRYRAAVQPLDQAFLFVADNGDEKDRLTFADLDNRSAQLATKLRTHANVGDRAFLVYPPGLDFFVGYFGCLYAGLIPVPIVPPRRNRLRFATLNIAESCKPAIGLTTGGLLEEARLAFVGQTIWDRIVWIEASNIEAVAAEADTRVDPDFETIAFLQYTSGSTSIPKGVMVSHGNLTTNLEMIQRHLGNTKDSTHVSWVPLYHDMGLILNALQTLYIGSLCVLISPAGFMQRPLTWLAAISKYRAEVAGGPNFGFDLCVSRFKPDRLEGLDLSCWRLAINGAEPVRAATLRDFSTTFAPYGFDGGAFSPCYGMAEGTLLLSGCPRSMPPTIRPVSRRVLRKTNAVAPAAEPADCYEAVGCGPPLEGERIAIVEPTTCRECAPGTVGEIWAAGLHVTQGYWQDRQATDETYSAFIFGTDEGPFLRTGDLGFMLDGELFVTGRLKDMIIVRGENRYPQDIEATAAACHPALRPGGGAAFMVGGQPEDKLVIVHEVERSWRHQIDVAELLAALRSAIVAEHELTVADVVLIRTGTLPKTSSGKVRRRETRELYIDGGLEPFEAGGRLADLPTA